jgi:hypothetical protein
MALAGALCAIVHAVTGFTNKSLRGRVADSSTRTTPPARWDTTCDDSVSTGSSNGSQDQHLPAHPKANTSRSSTPNSPTGSSPRYSTPGPPRAPIELRRAVTAIDHALSSYINDSRLGTDA